MFRWLHSLSCHHSELEAYYPHSQAQETNIHFSVVIFLGIKNVYLAAALLYAHGWILVQNLYCLL